MNDLSQGINRSAIDVPRAFKDQLFKDSSDSTDPFNELEKALYEQVTETLESSAEVSAFVPVLPRQMAAFLDEVAKEDTNFDRIREIVESDMSLAGETIRVANSPLYRRSVTEIESIGKAISMLGLDGVNLIASSLMMKQVLQIKSKELQQIGETLWKHCLECAEACRIINGGEDAFTAYLLGLVHDVGAVAIFSCYVNLLPNEQQEAFDSNRVLKLLLEEQTSWLSAHIAHEWKLPKAIIAALQDYDTMQQMLVIGCDKESKHPLARLLERANEASEVYTLVKSGIIDDAAGRRELLALGLAEEQISELFERFVSLSQ
jgi:HD-like signal output (HDOD) protein